MITHIFNPRRSCTAGVTVVDFVCLSVCLSVCLLSQISPLERLFVLKTLLHTQRATKVKIFVGFSLTPLYCRDPVLPALYDYPLLKQPMTVAISQLRDCLLGEEVKVAVVTPVKETVSAGKALGDRGSPAGLHHSSNHWSCSNSCLVYTHTFPCWQWQWICATTLTLCMVGGNCYCYEQHNSIIQVIYFLQSMFLEVYTCVLHSTVQQRTTT